MGKSAATVQSHVFAIKAFFARAGLPDPTMNCKRLWLFLRGLKLTQTSNPRKLGVTPAMLKWIHKELFHGQREPPVNAYILWARSLWRCRLCTEHPST